MNIAIYDKTYTATIPIRAGSTKNQFFFPTIDNLNGKFTTSIETFIPEITPVSTSNSPIASSALQSVSFLNLVVGDVIQIWNLPVLKTLNLNNPFSTGVANSLFQVEFNSLRITWAKSFIFIADVSQIDPSIDQEFQFNISYSDVKQP